MNIINIKTMLVFIIIIAGLPNSIITARTNDRTTPVNIGVLAHRGADKAVAEWTPTAHWLTSLLPEYTFHIVPLTNDNIEPYVAERKINFLLTNPASYASLEAKYRIARIATKRNLRQGNPYTVFGAIIFTRSDRDDIQNLSHLKDKSFMSVHKNAFGGWWMAKRELKDMGITENDLGKLEYSGFPQSKIVFAVRDGKVDAGTVRTDLLERLAATGKINVDDFRILNPQKNDAFPFALSTRLYPEWPFATLDHTPHHLAQEVAIALLTITPDNRAAKAARIAGWTVPLDYNDVHQLMRDLEVGPYKGEAGSTTAGIVKQHWQWLAISALVFSFVIVLAVYVFRLRKQASAYRTMMKGRSPF